MGVRSLAIWALLASLSASQEHPNYQKGPLASNKVCNTTLPAKERAQALVAALTLEEKLKITHNNDPRAPRIGLPSYNWWGEALHGIAGAPGVNFSHSGKFSYATSFPEPITMAASFDDDMIHSVGQVISLEARAYNNANRSGLDFWTPNINPFRDPRWGRGQETPGEDTYVVKQYFQNMVTGLQGPDSDNYRIIATCKHFLLATT